MSVAKENLGKVEPVFVDDISTMPAAIANFALNGDVIITMGAGSVGAVSGQVVELAGLVSPA